MCLVAASGMLPGLALRFPLPPGIIHCRLTVCDEATARWKDSACKPKSG